MASPPTLTPGILEQTANIQSMCSEEPSGSEQIESCHLLSTKSSYQMHFLLPEGTDQIQILRASLGSQLSRDRSSSRIELLPYVAGATQEVYIEGRLEKPWFGLPSRWLLQITGVVV